MKGYVNENNTTSGNVKIIVKDGDITREVITKHNKGTLNLCKFLRDALIGNASIDKLPDRIVPFVLNGEEQEGNISELLTYGILVYQRDTTFESEETSSASATIKFLIPSSVLTAGTEIDGFRLYSGKLSSATHYATVFLSNSLSISDNTSLLIDWTITISPKGEE